MSAFYEGIENWLVAERQLMTRPDALTAFLRNKAAMLDAVRFDPSDTRNTGATKARSHIDYCAKMIDKIEKQPLDTPDTAKMLGILASKSLKVASGFSMRAGYFHPSQPKELYEDRVVRLVDAVGNRLPVLGASISSLESLARDAVTVPNQPRVIGDVIPLLEAGQHTADNANRQLQEQVLEELGRNKNFSGSTESQMIAEEITLSTKSLFTALSIGALRLQQDGPDGLGPIILEPKSEAEADYFLRIEKLEPTIIDGLMSVSSVDPIPRHIM